MKNSSICLLFLMLSGVSAKADVFDDFTQAVVKQDESALKKVFCEKVDFELNGSSSSKLESSKASQEVMSFIRSNELTSFILNHKSNGNKSRHFAVGTYTSKSNKEFRITLVAIEVAGIWKISAVTIEKS